MIKLVVVGIAARTEAGGTAVVRKVERDYGRGSQKAIPIN